MGDPTERDFIDLEDEIVAHWWRPNPDGSITIEASIQVYADGECWSKNPIKLRLPPDNAGAKQWAKAKAKETTDDPTTAPRGLAQRWACWQGEPRELTVRTMRFRGGDGDQWEADPDAPRRLDDTERERLFAWVRENIGALYGRSVLRKTQSMAAKLGITDEQADALRRAARWPS